MHPGMVRQPTESEGTLGPPEIFPEEIQVEEEIGSGSFGKVYKGKCRQKPVAVKVLHRTFDKRTLLAFKREVKIMSKIFHPNICLFMGACLVPDKPCMMITELLPKGDVESLLHDTKVTLSIVLRMKMGRDAAFGMNWLHCSNPIFIHRDLKSSNLLVDNNMSVKVCDFGLSQLIPRDQKVKDRQNAKGTPLWMAPEVMMFQEFNEKCDVYSFGIVLWELLTRQEPFANYNSFDKFKEAVCIKKERPTIPKETVTSLTDLISSTWSPEPVERPSFTEIIDKLGHVIIDCAIRDPNANEFWKQNFMKREEVGWAEFLDTFSSYVNLPEEDRENNIKSFHALLEPKRDEGGGETISIEQFGKLTDWFSMERPNTADGGKGEQRMLDQMRELLMKDWFHGEISTADANQKLSTLPGGTFLVRFSSTHAGSYTISSVPVNGGNVKHQRVAYSRDKGYTLNALTRGRLEDIISDSDNLYIPCPGSKYVSIFVETQSDLLGYA